MSGQLIRDQLGIGQSIGSDQPEQCIPEQERVLAVVEPKCELVQVGVQVLLRELVIAPDDGALEQRPDALHAVGVDVVVAESGVVSAVGDNP
jgi:hypothetical protein